MPSRRLTRRFLASSVLWILIAPSSHSGTPTPGTAHFILDGNRMYAEVAFLRPDGTLRKALVFVDLGSPSAVLSRELLKELDLGSKKVLALKVGNLMVTTDSGEVTSDPWLPFLISDHRTVEGLLPAGILKKYQLVIDYAERTLTLAEPGTLGPEGLAVPFEMNEKTGLISVDMTISGKTYRMTIDNGSAYTWLRKATAQEWLTAHPDWQRGTGAVGPSNMRMADDGIEAAGILLRIPEVQLGPLRLREVGALAIGPSNKNWDFIDWYSKKNLAPVIGWLGGNVLRNFRITIDYTKHVSYWLRQSESDPHDLDQVGLTLESKHGQYFVAGVATQNGKTTVEGVEVGDQLLQIDGLRTNAVTWAAIYDAMHGRPGEVRNLVLERNGRQFRVPAKVTAF
ncbi:MAG TPA: hypothetical protein VHM93_04605 [Candidatus Acidoferrum sp.]|nr:hypothetical protein [Candidatus Acidoferrum sp.]